MDLSFSGLSLSGCLALCAYLSFICFTSPNPNPPKPYEKDRLMSGSNYARPELRRMFGISLFLWHLTFTALPPLRSSICLNPDLVNPGLTSWSWYTGTFVCIIFIAAPIRLQAYSRLGKNFTFMLAKPDKLVTTGIYSYVQHPSYTSLLVLTSAWFWTFLRLNGVSACFLPPWLVHIKALTLAPPILATLTTFFGITLRVKDEEEMLRKTFGKEYEEYHAKTKRFIPGLF